MGTTLAVCIICSQRTTGDLHLFKPPTFTFILNKSISGKKLSPWWVSHGSKTLSSSATLTPQPCRVRKVRAQTIESRCHSPVPSGQLAPALSTVTFSKCTLQPRGTRLRARNAEARCGGGSPAAASRQKSKYSISIHCTQFNTWR